ncbi:hypothetical protein [Legionella clemsonensis]|uniref:Uncharacterized protein n=1 Tax=Legionella clemsonensis TaxID=1867846 RepID=A0A222P6J6_9GAMM|nr:hypothetical protein [Legionella clemsonensis]ASQ47490.1 hypothetical protein clem_14825 [Legionella clemsonensis]
MSLTLERGTDKLATVQIHNIMESSAQEIVKKATSTSSLPNFKPDGCGVLLLFHTPDHKIYGLGGLRDNPALKDARTKDGKIFPPQLNTTIGGRLFDPELPLLQSILNAVKFKTFFEEEIKASPLSQSQQILHQLVDVISNSEGWGADICVHTDHWTNKTNTEETMCFLTAIKHINCTEEDLKAIEEALGTIMAFKESQGEPSRNLSNFKFYPFIPTMTNATADDFITYSELEKAQIAYENKAFVTFNDLALRAFKINNSYTNYQKAAEVQITAIENECIVKPG